MAKYGSMSEEVNFSGTDKDKLLEIFLGGDEDASADEKQQSGEEADLERRERERRGIEALTQILSEDPKAFEGSAFELLGSLIMGGVGAVDKAAELMMDKNPAGYVNAIFRVADKCKVPYIKFVLVRAMFRRYPGRYRPYILSLGHELISGEPDENTLDVTLWLLYKFREEFVPDLVSFMNGGAEAPVRLKVLQESVRTLGRFARPVVTAAADGDNEELRRAGLELLKIVDMV